ncbi:translation initiation factor IF-2 [Vermiconidia calcicola]|uniref:Translation initiation factor IF-2 n=1 Tax=Vermiconidia calcicola TaxID=1690605 RepID=A0ACC3NEZ5_9PEZI|nr:translation initiation factor IF-2 [Vermiconidia calcicola]
MAIHDLNRHEAEKREREHRRQLRLQQEQQQEQQRIAELERRYREEQERHDAARVAAGIAERKRLEDVERREAAAKQAERQRREEQNRVRVEERRRREEERQRGESSRGVFGRSNSVGFGTVTIRRPTQAQPQSQVQKMDMPKFGAKQSQSTQTVGGGWGSGVAEIKPISYAEEQEAEAARQRARGFDESGSVDAPPEPPQRNNGTFASLLDTHELDTLDQRRYKPQRRNERTGRGQYGRSWDSRNQDLFSSPEDVDDALPPTPQFPTANDIRPKYESADPFARPHTPQRVPYSNRPRSNTYPTEDEGGYRATPVTASDYRPPNASRYDESQADSWQHLSHRRTQSDPPPPPVSPAQLRNQPRRRPFDDPETLERNFRAHQQSRRPPPSPQLTGSHYMPPAVPSADPNPNIQSAHPRRCARCLEPGHTARECTSPVVKSRCKNCGEAGHMWRDCPKKREDWRSRPPVRSVGSTAHQREDPNEPSFFSTREAAMRTFERFSGAESERQPAVEARRPAGQQTEQRAVNPFERTSMQTEDSTTTADVEESEAEAAARRAKRLARGFADEEAEPEDRGVRSKALRRQQSSRRTIFSSAKDDDEAADEAESMREERAARKAARKAAREAAAKQRREQGTPVKLPEFISVQNLAQSLGVRYENFVERLERLGYDDLFPGKVLNSEISGMIAMEYSFDPIFESSTLDQEDGERDLKARPEVPVEEKETLPTRPPVVTIMGHVDHGKTTILDFLRKSSVAAGEAGGITQHIGAFSVPMSASGSNSGKTITFLDTPGHAAFLAMRQRGANVTDIVILVVAADDSVKPQTLESLRCAREAGVPILVAINKVDKEGADVQRVKQDLARNGVEIEDFGGEVQVVCVSGKTGEGMEELEEAVVTLSEILDHRAEVVEGVEGWVLEATTKSHGRVATVLVKRGTLRPGAVLVAGRVWARVKTLRNERGEIVEAVGPGLPVEVDGWREQASAGDEVLQAPSEQKAGSVVEYRQEKFEREKMGVDMEAVNEARRMEQEKRAREKKAEKFAGYGDVLLEPEEVQQEPEKEATTGGGQITVPFIIKADVSGSAEAVAAYIPSLTSPLITPQILSSSVGPIHESDIELASAAQGHIIAFNLPANELARGQAEARGVRVLENNVIYRVLDDVRGVLEEKLPPILSQRVLGEAEVGAVFEVGVGGRRKTKIAGTKVRNGVVGLRSRVRVLRGEGGEKVYDGAITSLKNVKKDVQEMRKGTECGMGFEGGWQGFEVGDLVQTYEEISEKRRLL